VSINLNAFDGAAEGMVLFNTTESNIEENVSIGVMADAALHFAGGNDSTQVRENSFRANERGILLTDSAATPNQGLTIALNCIQDNTDAGLQSEPGAYSGILDAEDNWWGSANGPTHPSNPGGTGDTVVDPDGIVDFLPFLAAPLPVHDDACVPPPPPTPDDKDACKKGGWMTLFDAEGNAFKNQGDCVSYVNHLD
jgi:nitrous oxidase accessory protein NosD